MSPSENKRAKRRKNKKGRPIHHNEYVETHPKSSADKNEKMIVKSDDDSNLSDKSVSKSFIPCQLFAEKQQCLCHCEQAQTEENVLELEQGSEDSCDENRKTSITQDYISGTTELSSYNIDPGAGINENGGEERSICHCDSCNERRVAEAEQIKEQQELRNCWSELKRAVHQLYRDAGLNLGDSVMLQQVFSSYKESNKLQSPEHLKDLLHRLCEQDPHKLFQCLEAQVHLFIVEMRLRLLRHLVAGKSSNGKSFIRTTLEEYAKLCSASKHLSPILQELETMHLKRFNITWELVNRYLFQSIVYSDPLIQNGIDLLIKQNDSSQDYQNDQQVMIKLNDEMTVISVVWREAQQLIEEYSKEQAAVRAKRKDWDMFNTHWKVLEEEIFNKSSLCNHYRCPCEECCGNRCHNTENVPPNLLTPSEITLMIEKKDSQSLGVTDLTCNHSTRSCGIQKSLSKSLISSVSNTHVGSCRECMQSTGILNEKYYSSISLKQDIEEMHGINHTSEALFTGKLSACHNSPSRRNCASEYSVSLPMHHHCCHNSSKDRNLLENHTRFTEQCILHSFCQGQNATTGLNPVFNSSVPLNSFSLSNTTINNLSLQDMTIINNHKPMWQPLEDEKREQMSEIGVNMKGTITTDVKQCECHACAKLKETPVPPAGPVVSSLLPVSHSRTSFPLFTHLNEISQNNSRPLIHPHLYNLQVGKANASGSQSNNLSHHAHCAVDLDFEEREVLQEQLYIATYGEWDYNAEDARPFPNYQKYGDSTLNNHFIRSHNSHLSRSSVSNISTTGRRKPTGHGSPAAQTDPEMTDDRLPSLPHSPTKTHLSSMPSNACTSPYCHGPVGSSGAKRHCHVPDTLRSARNQNINGDLHSSGNAGTQSGKNRSQTSDKERVHASTNSISNVPPTRSSELHGKDNQNDNQPVSTPYCEDTECESHVAEGEESVDDSCSEQSSSTSTSNQRESRVCDCCYCEVFGHGVPAVAPVSKNYPEMRERLRLRLSKRKAETGGPTTKSQDTIEPAVDNRALEELLNFINGNNNSPNKSKASKRQKKKKKAEEKIVKQLENCSLRSEEIYQSSDSYQKSKYRCPEAQCGDVCGKKTAFAPDPDQFLNGVSAQKNQCCGQDHNGTDAATKGIPETTDSGSGRSTAPPQGTDSAAKDNKKNAAPDSQSPKPSARSKKNKKKKNCLDDATSLDDVFLPKDIDLENGELDELEKELEAFKRFCFNSKPLARKEKVNVNLKDIVLKKKSQYASSGPNASSQNQKC
ncbi:uncharacterized protein LOC111616502 isoform X1 [Centruroides sculpturatus]|uniref:uncharacterized protein LOC111616502 isoform X1 n=2 Tax=Centruroides sculpturatus TaxID=218467 RepID=UPI000C6E2E7B|nr:uncharacterized protein LOC111616502 isoform X1 [Centruroides sculpturatus]